MFEPRQYDGVQGDVPRLTFSVSQAAELLGISRAKADECARTGELPVICFGRRLVVPAVALDRLLAGEEPLRPPA